ncbi:response regulator transcription factor [Catenulispora subtropica]|uniref:Response regulator transcription factor n=1 Tax=Catenulispora subtropica TaxID=450798 RepID=A0ABN2T9U3_9ACTN
MSAARVPVRVLVVDDQTLVRAGLVLLLDSQPDMEVVGEAGDGFDAVVQARTVKPDVVLMDIRMPGMDGLEATRRITAEAVEAAPRVVVLTTYDLDEYVYEALRAGSCGFLLKHAPPEELLLGIRAAADGGALLSPPVTARLIAEFTTRRQRPTKPPRELDRLTARERDVFDLVVRGRSNTEIAAELTVAETTVKTHLGHALDKLGLPTRVAAVVFGYETGMVRPGESSEKMS